MEKMQEEITVGRLKKGDVIGTKSDGRWPYGASVGEVVESSGFKLVVKDKNGFKMGRFARDDLVWVERDAPPILGECPHCGGAINMGIRTDNTKMLVDMIASYAPDVEAEDKLARIVGAMITNARSTDTALLSLAHLLTDGLAYGNWPWTTHDAKRIEAAVRGWETVTIRAEEHGDYDPWDEPNRDPTD